MIARLKLAALGAVAIATLFVELIGNHYEQKRDENARRRGAN